MRKTTGNVATLVGGILAATALFAIVNVLQPASGCSDCFAPRGLPFPYLREGGYGGGGGIVWGGVVADMVVVLAVGVVFAWLWAQMEKTTRI